MQTDRVKKAATIMMWLGALGIVWLIILITISVVANYQYNNKILSYWNLSVKASTLAQKSDYLNQFVSALQAADLGGNNALFLKTPDNSYDQNFVTLQSLQSRLQQIQAMDPSSFQYNQAIQQITAQEQDGADQMLSVFNGIWLLKNYPMEWQWIYFIGIMLGALTRVYGPHGDHRRRHPCAE